MLESVDFASVFTHIFDDLTIVLPIALLVLASLWAARLAISYLKGIANENDSIKSYSDVYEDVGYFQKEFDKIEKDKQWLEDNNKQWNELNAKWDKIKDGYI